MRLLMMYYVHKIRDTNIFRNVSKGECMYDLLFIYINIFMYSYIYTVRVDVSMDKCVYCIINYMSICIYVCMYVYMYVCRAM